MARKLVNRSRFSGYKGFARIGRETQETKFTEMEKENLYKGITKDEFVVLDIVKSLKSAYRDAYFKKHNVSNQLYALQGSLYRKGLLLKNGGITDAGRDLVKEITGGKIVQYYESAGYDTIFKKWNTLEATEQQEDPELNRGYTAAEIAAKWGRDEGYVAEQLAAGTKAEMEHTDDTETATRIASHHMYKESVDYYIELSKMEKKLDTQNSEKEAWKDQLEGHIHYFQDDVTLPARLDNWEYVDDEIGWVASVTIADQTVLRIRMNPEDSGEIIIDFPDNTSFAGDTGSAADYINLNLSKHATPAETDNQSLAEKLMEIDSSIDDKLKIESGGQLYGDIELQKKWKSELDKADIPAKLSNEIHEILEDENYHKLNQYLAMSGRYGQEEKDSYINLAKQPNNRLTINPSIFESVIVPSEEPEKTAVLVDEGVKTEFDSELEKINHIRKLIDERGDDILKYSAKELALLDTYTGMGGQAKKVEKGTHDVGILDQFYTPYMVIEKMFGLALKHGFKYSAGKKILEPACGIGRFFEYVPQFCAAVGYEIDKYAATITKLKFPNFTIINDAFETIFFSKIKRYEMPASDFDLVIGNPPYREFTSKWAVIEDSMKETEKTRTDAATYDQYFMMRGVDLLKPGGLLIFIIPNTFLSNDNKYNLFKEKLNKKAELIDAYRLPNKIFSQTDISTDIVVIKKR
ncbi:MAG: N-6 DNA methylase [Paludibacter sp.]|nr:N-6 DNA methylase [Paludibacter sp.]